MFFSVLVQGLGSGTGRAFLKGEIWIRNKKFSEYKLPTSVPDPDVLGSPGSGIMCTNPHPSINKQKINKTFIDFLSLKTDVNVSTESNKQNKFRENKTCFFVGLLEVIEEKIRIRIRKPSARIQGSGYVPKFTDPEHCHPQMGKEKKTYLRFRVLAVVFLTEPPFPGRQEILARDERHGVATAGRSGSANRAAVHRRSVLPSRLEHYFSLHRNYSTP
jgi:hypothetical protein